MLSLLLSPSQQEVSSVDQNIHTILYVECRLIGRFVPVHPAFKGRDASDGSNEHVAAGERREKERSIPIISECQQRPRQEAYYTATIRGSEIERPLRNLRSTEQSDFRQQSGQEPDEEKMLVAEKKTVKTEANKKPA